MMLADYARNNDGAVKEDDELENYYWVHWLSRQMSDHYPIWFELNIDSSVNYLESQLSKI